MSSASFAPEIQTTSVIGSSFYYLLVPALALWYVYWRIQRHHFVTLANKIPGPQGYPIVGNALEFFGKPAEIFEKVKKIADDYNNVAKAWIGPKLVVALFDPRDIELILSSQVHLDKSHEYDYFKPWLGDGLLISSGM